MNAIKTLIWNEWHLQRKSFFICVGISVVVWLLVFVMLGLSASKDLIELTAFIITVSFPFLFCCAISDSFSGEFVRKTDSFLLGLPIGTIRVYLCKYLFNLVLFIILTVFLVVLMFKFLTLTGGKSFVGRLNFQDTVSFGLTFLFIYVLIHATMFFATLAGRNLSSWSMTIVLSPVTYVLLLPGTFAVSALFPYHDSIWIIVSLIFTAIVLYCFWVGFGLYLWTRRISRGLKILKPVLISIVAVIIIPWLLYLAVYAYSIYDLSTVKREAKENGIILDFTEMIPPPIPADRNMAPEIMEFYRKYEEFCDNNKNNEIVDSFPSRCINMAWTKTSSSFSSIPKKLPFKTERRIADFILDNPEMRKLNLILTKAFTKPECRFDVDYDANNPSMILVPHLSVTRHVVDFLSDRAYALRLRGQNRDFFSCLNKIDKLSTALEKEPFRISKLVEISLRQEKYNTAIVAGPDTVDVINNYQALIREIEAMKLYFPNDVAMTIKTIEYLNSSPEAVQKMVHLIQKYKPQQDIFPWKMWSLLRPRIQRNLTFWLHWNIKRKKLFEKFEKGNSFPEIEKGSRKLRKVETRELFGLFVSYYPPNFNYCRTQAWFELYRIALALKIYHIEHWEFPKTLTPLSPEILPKIPTDPISGKEFEYQLKGNGFLLQGRHERNFYNTYLFYQPWDPTKKEEK